MNQSSFTLQALEQLRWINCRIPSATESERQALIGARAELVELILGSQARNKELAPAPATAGLHTLAVPRVR